MKEKHEDTNMKKKTLHPIMIALLALFVLLQAFCLTAFGAETVEVYIPAGTETETVNQILTETLLPDSEDTLEWEYECVGKEDGGLLKNTARGSVGGFENTTKKYFVTHAYIHPALADNADGEYQVRTGEKKFKIRKAAKHTVDFELRRNQEIPLIYDEDGTFNAEETKEEIFTRVFSASNAEFITCDDVTIQYYGTAESGAVGNLGKDWVALDGEKVNLLTYPVIPAGKQKIRISWDGDEEYSGFEKETDVIMTEREQMKFNLKEAPYEAGLVFDHDQNIDYTATAKAIYEAVVDSTEPEVDFDEFAVKYNADPSGLIENFKPLDDESLVTKKFGTGSWKIRISWGGSRDYAPGSVTINKANVKVSVNSASRYVSEAVKGRELVSTDPEDHFNLYIIYAGITSNVTTGVYLELPEQYTSNSTVIKIVDKALESLNQPTLTEMLQNGITVGELRKLVTYSHHLAHA